MAVKAVAVTPLVLGDDEKWEFANLADQYFILGFSDFKIKINGSLEKDRAKLKILKDLCNHHNIPDVRIRLDANNLWTGRPVKTQ